MNMEIYSTAEISNLQFYNFIPEGKYDLVLVNFSRGSFGRMWCDIVLKCDKLKGKLLPFFLYFEGKKIFIPYVLRNITNLSDILGSVIEISKNIDLSKSENQFFPISHEGTVYEKWFQDTAGRPECPIPALLPTEKVLAVINLYSMFSEYILNFFGENAYVIDAGSGSGIGSITLAKKLKNVFAADKNRMAISFLKSFDISDKVKIICGDITEIGVKNKFDAVVAADVIEHNENFEEIIEHLQSLIKDEGKIFVNLPTWENHGVDVEPYHRTGWSRRKVWKVFSKYSDFSFIDDKNLFFFFGKHKKNSSDNGKGLRILLICHNIPKYELTGTPIHTFSVAKKLKEKGVEVAILTPIGRGMGVEVESVEGIKVYKVNPIPYYFSVFEDIYHTQDMRPYLKEIEGVINDFQPDICHIVEIVGFSPKIYQLISDLGCRILRDMADFTDLCWRVNMTIDETEEICSGPELIKCSLCFFRGSKDENEYFRILRFSQIIGKIYAFQNYRKYVAEKLVDKFIFPFFPKLLVGDFAEYFIKNGFPVEKFIYTRLPLLEGKNRKTEKKKRDFSKEKIRITYCASSLTKFKCADIVLGCFEKIASKYDNFVLNIYTNPIGKKEYFEKMKKLAKTYPEKIVYKGTFSDFRVVAEDTDIALLPAGVPEFNLTMRSFISYGIPFITTEMCQRGDLLKDMKNCLLIKAKRDFDGFAKSTVSEDDMIEKIEYLLNNPNIIEKLEEGVAEMQKEFITLDEFAEELINIYSSILKISEM